VASHANTVANAIRAAFRPVTLAWPQSREAVLLELLDLMWQEWLADLEVELSRAVDANASRIERASQVASALATSLASRPVLCDLIGAQAAVLERNVSPQVAAGYKWATLANVTALGHLALGCIGELGERDSVRLAGAAMMMTGGLWPHTQPSAAMLAAYQADPALAAMRLDFTATMREVLEVLIARLLAHSSR
jgi:hypothetical protein